MVRSSTSLTPNQKHHAFFFPEKALFSFSHGNIRDQNLALKKKKNSWSLFQGSFHSVKKRMRKTKKRGACERSSLTYAVSLHAFFAYLCCLLSLLFFLFFSALDKRKRRREKRKEQPLRSRVHLRPRTWLLHSTEFFFFSF